MKKRPDKHYLEKWQEFRQNIDRATPVDLNENPVQKKNRIAKLEANEEEWFKYYFPNHYTSEPADFHRVSTKIVLSNPEYYLVRSWSRELSKSGRTMMEVLYLALTGKKKNILLVSNSYDNAERLLLPYKALLEANNRIINDYGIQQSIGKWETGEFTTRKGVSFRAIGAGQSPRGTKNDAVRPDVILIDDIDTDQDCRNPDTIKQRVDWIEQALLGTRSISNPMLVIACGNIIAEYCCITEMAAKADRHEIINIRDEYGNSSWPQKNTEVMIDRVLSVISYNSAQKEYFNNPVQEGDTFEEVRYAEAPPIQDCEIVVCYADPATSNKDKKHAGKATANPALDDKEKRQAKSKTKTKQTKASCKCVLVVGLYKFRFYTYWIRLGIANNNTFVDWLFEADKYLQDEGVDPRRIFIENNTLQDPFYEQVILPLIYAKSGAHEYNGEWFNTGNMPPIREDTRKKPEKYDRIEGTLEPIDRMGNLLFDKKLEGTPHMKVMHGQMLGVSPDSKVMDGPDTLEGAVHIIQKRRAKKKVTSRHGKISTRKY
jgi:hypothetical protein